MSEAWLSSDYLGAASPVKITIGADKRISFNQDAYIQSLLAKSPALSRGITTNEHKYLDDWMHLPGVDWDDNGRPNNLSAEKNIPPASVLYNIKSVFSKKDGNGILQNYPEFFDGKMVSDIPIIKIQKSVWYSLTVLQAGITQLGTIHILQEKRLLLIISKNNGIP